MVKNQSWGFLGQGLGGSGSRGYRWIELAEFYLEHYLTQLEHVPGRIAGGITLEQMLKNQYLRNFSAKGWETRVGDDVVG